MSIVVAIKQNNNIYLGCDSQTTSGGTRNSLKNPNNFKIFKVKGINNCLIGYVGRCRDASVLKVKEDFFLPEEIESNIIDYQFVVQKFVPRLIEELKKYKYVHCDEDYFEEMNSSYVLAYKNNLYQIGTDGCVMEIDDCCVIGSASCEAAGSLLSTLGKEPKERIITAIKASAAHDIYVDYPIVISNTKNTKFEIINENNI